MDGSTMMNSNWQSMVAEEKARRMKEARMHTRFCVKVYKHESEAGRYFVHEHPQHASPWHEPEMKQMLRREGNILAGIDQCQYGLLIEDNYGWALAKEPTRSLTNPVGTAQGLQKTCPGKNTHPEQRHAVPFVSGSKKAQVYPCLVYPSDAADYPSCV